MVWFTTLTLIFKTVTLARIAHPQRITLRRQAGMLLLWACVVGFATSALLLHRYSVQSMAIRYMAVAGVMYFLGFVVGAYACLRWWVAMPPSDAHYPAEALPDDAALYREQVVARRDHWLSISRWWHCSHDNDDDTYDSNRSLLGTFFGWLFQLLIGFILSVLATLMGLVFGYLPIVLAEALAGFLAVLLLKFVIGGRALAHYATAPILRGYWQFVLGKTGLAGLACMAVAAGAGYWLEVNNPTATDLIDVILPPILAELPPYVRMLLPSFLL